MHLQKRLNASSKCVNIQKHTYIFSRLSLVFSDEAGDYALPSSVNSLEHSEKKTGMNGSLISEGHLVVWNLQTTHTQQKGKFNLSTL